MSTRYAAETKVTVDRSQSEIRELLRRHGATSLAFGQDDEVGVGIVGFKMAERHIRLRFPLPKPNDPAICRNVRGNLKPREHIRSALAQAERQRWRAVLLVLKAKLEAVELGIETLEQAFLSDIMLSDGSTVGEWVGPQLEAVYRDGRMPALLPGLSESPLALGSGVR